MVALLGLCIASGLTLAAFFDPAYARDSLERVELTTVAGRLARSAHGWTAWLALAAAVVVVVKSAVRERTPTWWMAVRVAALAAACVVLARHPFPAHAWLLPPLLLACADRPRWRASTAWVFVAVVLAVLVPMRRFMAPWGAARPASATAVPIFQPLSLQALRGVPVVAGHREGCVGCHADVTGLGPGHEPSVVGCVACHGGDGLRPDATGAHRGMLRVPGNLDSVDVSCGTAGCHQALSHRVRAAPMNTLRGMIAVDRFVFGARATPDGTDTVAQLGDSPADSHLRSLCIRCHLGEPKQAPAPVSMQSRGGGCVACHLTDTPPRTPVRDNPRAFVHPGLSVRIPDDNCAGCHSRSGRISLNYAGWYESAGGARRLEDGRTLARGEPDVHHARGMACIDCHTAYETMGDGVPHAHQEDATRVRCETCHRPADGRAARAVRRDQLDAEAGMTVRLRDGNRALAEFLVEDDSGETLTNARPLPDGRVEVRGKLDGRARFATPPGAACTTAGHTRLSCQACHAAWAPRCVGCHTQADPALPGGWVEYDVAPSTGAPALGLWTRRGQTRVEPFVPGMVMTLNGPDVSVPVPLPEDARRLLGPGTRYIRAYAPAVPHTTTRKGRTCRSCHADPAALGYGMGTVSVHQGAWRFDATYAASAVDGLPADAWIGFGAGGESAMSTRTSARPLDRTTRERVLAVGACLECHAADAAIYRDFTASRAALGPRCVLPRMAE